MKKKILSLFAACCVITGANAQIVGPATTTGTATFSSPAQAFTYTWDFNGLIMNPNVAFTGAPVIPTSSLATPSYGCFVKDHGNYFYYVNEYNTGNLYCYPFGPTFPSVPGPRVLVGNYGAWQELEGVDVVQDGGGHWYAIMMNNNSLIELDLGTSLGGLPVATNIIPEPTIYWAHQVTVMQFDAASGGGWHAFVADRNGMINRLDFGATISSLMTAPTVTAIPNTGGVYTPCNFAIWHQVTGPNIGWYMLVPSLITADMTLYSFGSSLMNIPTGTMEPHASKGANLFRACSIYEGCDGNLFALQFDETGDLLEYSFHGGDISIPLTVADINDLGPTGGTSLGSGCPASATSGLNGINSYSYLVPDFINGQINMYNPFIPLTANSYADYFISTQTNTFTGSAPITLIYDMGRPSGPSMTGMIGAYACSQIQFVKPIPCYDANQTTMQIVPSATDPCSFTACVNVATPNMITGYTWDVEPGGLTYTDLSGLPTDCFTFSIAPGIVYTVSVTVNILQQDKTCCQAVLTQTVTCGGDASGPGPQGRAAHPNANDVQKGIGSDITVFPNPTNDAIAISSSSTVINSIQLFDMWGKKLSDNSFDGTKETSVSLNKLPAGTYIIRVNNSISKIISKE